MNDSSFETTFFVPRASSDRRNAGGVAPPYFTEEGIVMFDRREIGERRKEQSAADASALERRTERAAFAK